MGSAPPPGSGPGSGPGDDGGRSVPTAASSPAEVALLDEAGVIVWVNAAWNAFCRANGGDPTLVGPGVSYLALCDEAAGEDATSARVAQSIRSALDGDLPAPDRITIPCPAPDRPRDFDVLISSRLDDRGEPLGATVTLSATRTAPSAHRPSTPSVPIHAVVEQLWVAGLHLQAAQRATGDERHGDVIDQLDECIDRLRDRAR